MADLSQLPEKLRKSIEVHDDGCWIWTGGKQSMGYGWVYIPKLGMRLAHRFTYATLIGPIPEGLELDHLCRVPTCVNPEHLEPVTHRENVLRGQSPTAIHAAKTHCKRGHPFDERNTIWIGTHRRCRECVNASQRTPEARAKNNEWQNRRRAEKRAAAKQGSEV